MKKVVKLLTERLQQQLQAGRCDTKMLYAFLKVFVKEGAVDKKSWTFTVPPLLKFLNTGFDVLIDHGEEEERRERSVF